MAYQHKDSPCSKETKEILENIMSFKKRDYELAASDTPQEISEKSVDESAANPLTSEAEEILTEVSTLGSSADIEGVEQYAPVRELNFDVAECAHVHEKKKKCRNYLEAKMGYEF